MGVTCAWIGWGKEKSICCDLYTQDWWREKSEVTKKNVIIVILTSTVLVIVSDSSKTGSCWTDAHSTVCS